MSDDLLALLEEGRRGYDPWYDLERFVGIDLRWYNRGEAPMKSAPDALGVTTFHDLAVSLQYGIGANQLRSVLAHELIHLERGWRADTNKARALEENRVELLAAQRLIDPVIFDAVMSRYDGNPTRRQINMFLRVDLFCFGRYRDWRKRVTERTAAQRWEQALILPPWPAPWLEDRHLEVIAAAHPNNVIDIHPGATVTTTVASSFPGKEPS